MNNRICNVPTHHHILKLREEFCDDVFAGYKTFEVRENDRGYQKGDTVQFECVDKAEMNLQHYINDEIYEITYVLNGWGIKENYVVFGIRRLVKGE